VKVWVLLRERSDHTTAHAVCADRASLERKLDSIRCNNPYPLRQVGDNSWTIGPTEDEGFFGNKPLHLSAVEVSAYGLAAAALATPEERDDYCCHDLNCSVHKAAAESATPEEDNSE